MTKLMKALHAESKPLQEKRFESFDGGAPQSDSKLDRPHGEPGEYKKGGPRALKAAQRKVFASNKGLLQQGNDCFIRW